MLCQIWGAAAQLRGEVKAKASILISESYGIPGLLSADEIKERVEWLLKKNTFADGDLDLKVVHILSTSLSD